MTTEDLRAELTAQLNSEPYMTLAETVDGVMVVLDRLGVIDHANKPVSSHVSEHAAAAEDLRERVDNVITDWATDPRGRRLGDLVLAALAGDPGDLPARMAAELNSHEWEPSQRHTAHRKHNYHGACAICQEDLPRIAAVALSVRWEHAASQAAEVERLRAELATAKAEVERLAEFGVKERERYEAKLASLQGLADRCREKDWAHSAEQARRREQAEAERDEARRQFSAFRDEVLGNLSDVIRERNEAQAEGDALKAAVEEVRVDAERHLRETGTTADRWKLGVYAQAARTMRILNHVLAAPETPGDADA